MKYSIKRVVIIFLSFILGFVAVVALLFATKQPRGLWEQYYERIALNRATAERTAWEAMMRADTYGGETPEQTFALFLDALKSGDIDLASKYFEGEKQEEWKGNLEKIKEIGKLGETIEEFVAAENNWRKMDETVDRVYYSYSRFVPEQTIEISDGKKTTFPAGEYGQTVIFSKNNYASIWKISQL